jgi:hypothetical protein
MKDDKFLSMIDGDVKVTYERRETPVKDDINGFNPIILVGVFFVVLIAFVVISQNEKSTPVQQQSPVIINNN